MNDHDCGDRANDCVRGDHDHHHRQVRSPFRRTWVKVGYENVHAHAHVHDCVHHANGNAPTPRVSRFQ